MQSEYQVHTEDSTRPLSHFMQMEASPSGHPVSQRSSAAPVINSACSMQAHLILADVQAVPWSEGDASQPGRDVAIAPRDVMVRSVAAPGALTLAHTLALVGPEGQSHRIELQHFTWRMQEGVQEALRASGSARNRHGERRYEIEAVGLCG